MLAVNVQMSPILFALTLQVNDCSMLLHPSLQISTPLISSKSQITFCRNKQHVIQYKLKLSNGILKAI